MKTLFSMHGLFGAMTATALAAMLAVALSGCDKQAGAPAAANTSAAPAAPSGLPNGLPTPAEEDAAKRDADTRRKQFYGNGQSRYTPQDVHGF